MLTTATGRPPLSSTAWRITGWGIEMPTVAMRTAQDCVGCLSHFPLPNRALAGVGPRPSTALPARVLICASACIGSIARDLGDSGRLRVDGVHVVGIQDVGLLHVVE